MKKTIIIFVIIIAISVIGFLAFIMHGTKNIVNSFEENRKTVLISYLNDVYGRTFLIPEFTDINNADEKWLWENVNQYIWNHEDDYKEQVDEEFGFTYDEISKIAQKLYGLNLKKSFPKGAVNMRYSSYDDLYGVSAYSIDYYYDYRIDSITNDGNKYTVSIYDYVVSNYKSYGNHDDENHNNFDIFNIYDFELNGDDATPIISFKDYNDKSFTNLLDKKDKLSHKTLTFEFDNDLNLPHIVSCKYENTSANDTLSTAYKKVIDSFDIRNIEYDREDVYELDEIEVENFDDLSSIYTNNGKELFKNEYTIINFKEDGKAYIRIGEELDTSNYLSNIHFEDIKETDNKITATCIRSFRGSFDPGDEEYNIITSDNFTFVIVKENDEWLIDEFKFGR